MCGAKEVAKAKEVAESIVHEDTSLHDAAQLMRDEHMPTSAPQEALQDLAYLGAACMSLNVACRPDMGCTTKDRDSIVGRLAVI